MFVLSPELLQAMQYCKGTRHFKFILNLVVHRTLSEETLMNNLKATRSDITKIYLNLLKNDIVIRWRSKNENIPYYTLHPKFFDISESCLDCKYRRKKTRHGVKLIECKINGKDCIHDHHRSSYNNYQIIKKTCEQVGVSKIERKYIPEDYKEKSIDQWKIMDFVKFFQEESKENFPEIFLDNVHNIVQNIRGLIQSFKERFDNNWRRMLRLFIRKRIEFAKKEGKYINAGNLGSGAAIAKFMNNQGVKDKADIEFCEIKGLYCTYMKKKCQVKKNNLPCTKIIRKKMRKLYN